MITNEIALLSILGTFGMLVGGTAGMIAAKKVKEIGVAIVVSALTAVIFPLVFWFGWSVIDALAVRGKSLREAMLEGLGVVFILSFAMPFVTGLPAVISASVSFLVFQKRHKRSNDQP